MPNRSRLPQDESCIANTLVRNVTESDRTREVESGRPAHSAATTKPHASSTDRAQDHVLAAPATLAKVNSGDPAILQV